MKTFIILALVFASATAAPRRLTLNGSNGQLISNVQNVISINNVNTLSNEVGVTDEDSGEGPTLGDILASLGGNSADLQPMPLLPEINDLDVDVNNFQNIGNVQNVVSINNVNTVANEVQNNGDKERAMLKTIMDSLHNKNKNSGDDNRALDANVDVDNVQRILNEFNVLSINNVNTVANEVNGPAANQDLTQVLKDLNKIPDLKKAVAKAKNGEKDGAEVDVTNIQNIANVLNVLSVNNVNTIANDVQSEEQLQALMNAMQDYLPGEEQATEPKANEVKVAGKGGDLEVDFVNAQNILNVRNILSVNNVNTISNDVDN